MGTQSSTPEAPSQEDEPHAWLWWILQHNWAKFARLPLPEDHPRGSACFDLAAVEHTLAQPHVWPRALRPSRDLMLDVYRSIRCLSRETMMEHYMAMLGDLQRLRQRGNALYLYVDDPEALLWERDDGKIDQLRSMQFLAGFMATHTYFDGVCIADRLLSPAPAPRQRVVVCVFDDAVYSGSQMAENIASIRAAGHRERIYLGVVAMSATPRIQYDTGHDIILYSGHMDNPSIMASLRERGWDLQSVFAHDLLDARGESGIKPTLFTTYTYQKYPDYISFPSGLCHTPVWSRFERTIDYSARERLWAALEHPPGDTYGALLQRLRVYLEAHPLGPEDITWQPHLQGRGATPLFRGGTADCSDAVTAYKRIVLETPPGTHRPRSRDDADEDLEPPTKIAHKK